ncbi:MAG: pirin family protein [Phycisphaerales bacterium]|nr:pirin family protein [Phycisphaerales bacterium]
MITMRKGHERGHFDHGWLDTYHTFSFGDYRDPAHMGFRVLRVINEDVVAPGKGFDMHPHRDMEIITYVLNGQLEHRDSLGNGAVIQPGTVQYMAAGAGIVHGEFNPSPTTPVHLMQVWIFPDRKGLPPRYEQRDFPSAGEAGRFTLLASGDGRDGSIRINQDASLLAAKLRHGQELNHALRPNRHGWVQVMRGSVLLGGNRLAAGDAAAISGEPLIEVKSESESESELLLFDLP